MTRLTDMTDFRQRSFFSWNMKHGRSLIVGFALLVFSLTSSAVAQLRPLEHPEGITGQEILAHSLPSPLRQQVEQAIEKRDYPRAEKVLVDEVHRQPRSPDLLKVLGGIFFLDGKYLNAAIAYKKAEAIVPLDPRSRFTLAMSYIILGHRDWARPVLEKLNTEDPKNFLYPYWLSRLDYDAMLYTDAIREAKESIKLNPHFVNAYESVGLCQEALGKYDEAIQAYRQAIQLNHKPECSPWPGLNLGALLVKINRLDEAEGALKDSLQCDERFPNAHYQLGLLLERQGRDAEAIEQLQKAVSLKPDFADPYYALGRAYRRVGNEKKAQLAFGTFQKLKEAKHKRGPK